MPISCCTSVALTARITHAANVLPCCFGVHVYELWTAAVLHVAAADRNRSFQMREYHALCTPSLICALLAASHKLQPRQTVILRPPARSRN